MPLTPGQTLTSYQIVAPLGSGGMGEVYRARDNKLGRDVAIKVLPEGFADDAERPARFEREAKVLASLNHPNIAAIYGLEESEGTPFLVMELVEGSTLDDRIGKGRLLLDKTLSISRQIWAGLEAAHDLHLRSPALAARDERFQRLSHYRAARNACADSFLRPRVDLDSREEHDPRERAAWLRLLR